MEQKENNKAQRNKKGIIVGLVGLFLNLLLGVFKLIVGFLTNSVSIISDAVNNITDAFSSVVTSASFYLASRKADKEHPYGHGRYEYIAGLVIGIVILYVGIEFLKASIEAIISPNAIFFSIVLVVVLSVSIVIKLAMGIGYRIASQKLNSSALKASSYDSFFDALITFAVLIGLVIEHFTAIKIDGFVSIVVSGVIILGGFTVLKDTIGRLLGNNADIGIANRINEIVTSGKNILGVHDLKVHEYGPDRLFASIHVEIDATETIIESHKIIDEIESTCKEELGVELVIHCDPINRGDSVITSLISLGCKVLEKYDGSSLHEIGLSSNNSVLECYIKLPEKFIEYKSEIEESFLQEAKIIEERCQVVNLEVEIIY